MFKNLKFLEIPLSILGNGTASPYATINYKIHSNGTPKSINISANNKLYIKAKGTNFPNLRIDLLDNLGYNTNYNGSSINLTNSYAIYEINYTGKLLDGGYGGPCLSTAAPCSVNPASIINLNFFINAASGNYNGKIDIDWISFGQPLEAITIPHKILVNQVGYFVGKDKIINFSSDVSFTGINYSIKNEFGTEILNGTSAASVLWSDSQQYVASINVSNINSIGKYTITTSADEKTFTIGNNVYEDLSNKSLKYFYYNRASIAITSEFGGAWARATGIPDTSVFVHSSAASANRPTGTIISASKGWYDAGDYNKYVVNSGISTYTLLSAFEQYKSYFQNKNFNIPESSNTLPDLLDEVCWNLDWMLNMQDRISGGGDGGVYHKLTELNFSGNVMPSTYSSSRYVVKKSTAAALNFAAVMAVASRIFSNYNTEKPGFSATLLTAAREAYTWAKNNPTVYFSNPSGVNTGEYGDGYVGDEFQWAAIELFITTNETQYKSDINMYSLNGSVPNWGNTGTLGLISILHNATSLGAQIDVPSFNAKIINTANQIKTNINASPLKIGLITNDYVWGSNSSAANQIMILLNAYEATKDISYLNAAYQATDYLLGRNGSDKCFVTGFGEKPVMNPHHRISESDGIALPVPGMLAGGPHPNAVAIDGCVYPNNYAASSYSDSNCSYSTNEVAINWNAPLVYIINALQFYQNQSLSVVDNEIMPINNLVVYPNPATDELNIERNIKFNGNLKIDIFDINGKTVYKSIISKEESKINIHSLSKGVYFLKVSSKENLTTIKFLKQ
ncbi:MAG: glycoside hydrolase family 9 protein [Flavobacteriaceae bacterium]|nr:glycoside hydrolase family 9 protein [Flavobacteriaceae bacterium]